jgi:hypothetical protein
MSHVTIFRSCPEDEYRDKHVGQFLEVKILQFQCPLHLCLETVWFQRQKIGMGVFCSDIVHVMERSHER